MKVENSWVNLVMISTLDRKRNKAQISKAWDISVSGGPLYQRDQQKAIEKAVSGGLLEKDDKGAYRINMQSDYFRNSLVNYIDKKINEEGIGYETAQYFAIALENKEGFINFLSDSVIKEELFDIEIVKKYFTNTDNAREDPWRLFTAVTELFVYPYTIDWLETQEGLSDQMRGMFKPMVKMMLGPQISSNQKPLKERIMELYEEHPEKFNPLKKMYEEIISKKLKELF